MRGLFSLKKLSINNEKEPTTDQKCSINNDEDDNILTIVPCKQYLAFPFLVLILTML